MTGVCQIEKCGSHQYAKGLCRSHYNKQWLTSHPAQHKKHNERSRVWNAAHRSLTRGRSRAWYATHKDLAQARERARHIANPDAARTRGRIWHAANPEHASVRSHHGSIFGPRVSSYRGMPFFDGWNPDTGGSFKAGAEWIIKHLGRRPDETYQLHIIDRRVGFMPKNLVWVPRAQHRQDEFINRLLLENQKLKKRLGRAS